MNSQNGPDMLCFPLDCGEQSELISYAGSEMEVSLRGGATLESALFSRKMGSILNTITPGDCREILKRIPQECVDLVVTSPPYADRRSKVYGGILPTTRANLSFHRTR